MKTSTIVAVLIALVAVLGGWYWWSMNGGPAMPGIGGGPQACTMEAFVCPDGTSVGRTGPNCSFAPCPTPTSTQHPVLNGSASTTIQTGTASDDPGLGDASMPITQ